MSETSFWLRKLLLVFLQHFKKSKPNFSAWMLLAGRQEGHLTCKKYGGMVEVGTG